jgi:methionyl aminopeptidase
MITIKSDEELKIMREAGRIVGQVLQLLREEAKAGMTTLDFDKIVRHEYAKRGAIATFVGYPPGSKNPFRHTICTSVNDELVHGVPSKDKVLKEGDILSLDLGATFKGFVGDSAVTIGIGEIDEETQKLLDVTKESLWRGIRAAKAGVRLGTVSAAIGDYIESEGYGVVREYVGHGVGRQMHEDPQVPNYGVADTGPVLRKGMVLALEPMVTIGDYKTKRLADGWTVSTADGSLCAHFEHTIAILDGEAEVLTLP